jgi:hypothetical protein
MKTSYTSLFPLCHITAEECTVWLLIFLVSNLTIGDLSSLSSKLRTMNFTTYLPLLGILWAIFADTRSRYPRTAANMGTSKLHHKMDWLGILWAIFADTRSRYPRTAANMGTSKLHHKMDWPTALHHKQITCSQWSIGKLGMTGTC